MKPTDVVLTLCTDSMHFNTTPVANTPIKQLTRLDPLIRLLDIVNGFNGKMVLSDLSATTISVF